MSTVKKNSLRRKECEASRPSVKLAFFPRINEENDSVSINTQAVTVKPPLFSSREPIKEFKRDGRRNGTSWDSESIGLFEANSEGGISTQVSRSQRLRRAREHRQQQLKQYYQLEAGNRSGVPPSPRRRGGGKVDFELPFKLQDAVTRFDTQEVIAFLNAGADPNTASECGVTILHQCCIDDNLQLAEVLVQRRANVNLVDDDRWTPLHTACACECTEIMQLLLNNGADVTCPDVDGNLPMDLCPRGSETRATIDEFMYESGYDHASIQGIKQSEGLRMLAEVKDFLGGGGYINTENDEQVTLLHIAAANNYLDVAKLLIRKGATIDTRDNEGDTPLHLASKYGHSNVVKLLLSANANPEEINDHNLSPTDVASSDAIEELIKTAGLTYEPGKRSSVILADIFADDPEEIEPDTAYRKIQKGSMPLAKTEARYEAETRLPPDGSEDLLPMVEQPRVRLEALISVDETEETNLPDSNGTDNLSLLPELTENGILEELMKRYSKDIIYTYVGDILIAINPFKDLPLYSKKASRIYTDLEDRGSVTPHVFAVADRAYQSFLWEKASQCCIISGESGAGKTETTKYFLRHLLLRASSEENDMNDKIQQVNPLLEVFGNAKTSMNDNSSRFGKFISLLLTDDGQIAGARLSEYLLEKSRVTHQGEGEKNFHIFYLLFSGMNQQQKARLGLKEPQQHRYLQKGDLSDLDGPLTSPQRFRALKSCLTYIGFTLEDEDFLFDILASVILFGDLKFVPDLEKEGAVIPIPNSAVQKLAELLRVDADELKAAIVSESIMTRGEEIKKNRTKLQAQDCRDALAKAIYSRLFSWVVNNINILLQPPDNQTGFKEIGVLDIFGFENFNKNSFEQICINLANEKLQGFFNEHIFQSEKADCEREGIDMSWFTFSSNEPTIKIFLEKNRGIMDLLIEESHFPRGTDQSLANKLHNGPGKWGKKNYFTPRDGGTSFSILHYAGIVTYSLDGVVEKNRDTLAKSLVSIMKSSENRVIREMFSSKVTRNGSIGPSFRQISSKAPSPVADTGDSGLVRFHRERNRSGRRSWKKGRSVAPGKGKSRKGGSVTVANHFKNSLYELMEKMRSANPHFIRCIKPNTTKASDGFVPQYVVAQLRYTGIMETTKIRRDGYPLRLTVHEFMERFGAIVLLTPTTIPNMSPQRCRQALEHHQIEGFKLGKTKLFFKHYHTERLQQISYELTRRVIICQKVVKGFLCRKNTRHTFQKYHSETRAMTDFLADLEIKMATVWEVVQYIESVDEELEAQKQRAEEDETKHMEEETIDDLIAVAEEEEKKTSPTMEGDGPNNLTSFGEGAKQDLDDLSSLKTSTISSLSDSFNDLPDSESEKTVQALPPDEPPPPPLSDPDIYDDTAPPPPPPEEVTAEAGGSQDIPGPPDALYVNCDSAPVIPDGVGGLDDLPPPPPEMNMEFPEESFQRDLPSPPLTIDISEEGKQAIANRRNAFLEMERKAKEEANQKPQIKRQPRRKEPSYVIPDVGPHNGMHNSPAHVPQSNGQQPTAPVASTSYVNNQINQRNRQQPRPPSRSDQTRLSGRGRSRPTMQPQQEQGAYEELDGDIPPPPNYPAPIPPASPHRQGQGSPRRPHSGGYNQNIPPPPPIPPPAIPTAADNHSYPKMRVTQEAYDDVNHDPQQFFGDYEPLDPSSPPPPLPPPNHPLGPAGPPPPPLPPVSSPHNAPSSMSQQIGAIRLKPSSQRALPPKEADPRDKMMDEISLKLMRRRQTEVDTGSIQEPFQKTPPPPTSPKPAAKDPSRFGPTSPPPPKPKPKLTQTVNQVTNKTTSLPRNGIAQPEVDDSLLPPIDPSVPAWKRAMLEKKRKEELVKLQEEQRMQQEEENKWKDIPEWKKNMILSKQRKKAEEDAKVEEANKATTDLEAKLAAMPEWKRKVFLKKMEKGGNDENDNQQAVS